MSEKTNFELFAISQNNYKELLKDKSFAVYKAFFEVPIFQIMEKYLKSTVS